MDTTSPRRQLNKQDLISLLKNVIIFFGPALIVILNAIDNGEELTLSLVKGAVMSVLIKGLEYLLRDNKV